MPAIRYRKNGSFSTVSHIASSPKDLVNVLLKNGEPQFVEWLGFICIHAKNHIIGRNAKIIGNEVSHDDGGLGSIWHLVRDDEFILGWMVERFKKDRMMPGVYGVVGNDSWPIVLQKDPSPKIRKLNATVTEIVRRKTAGR